MRAFHSRRNSSLRAPLRISRPVPSRVIGMTGTFSLAATVKAPFLNSAIWPVAERVPWRTGG